MLGCQATGREQQHSVWKGLLGGGGLSIPTPLASPPAGCGEDAEHRAAVTRHHVVMQTC